MIEAQTKVVKLQIGEQFLSESATKQLLYYMYLGKVQDLPPQDAVILASCAEYFSFSTAHLHVSLLQNSFKLKLYDDRRLCDITQCLFTTVCFVLFYSVCSFAQKQNKTKTWFALRSTCVASWSRQN
eukprot:m.181465 g.181465  ORF g.181465 m.181465 type:complete len:127 (-) comp16629_c0_seq2:995-1375(-)